jgi:hypothetical protein
MISSYVLDKICIRADLPAAGVSATVRKVPPGAHALLYQRFPYGAPTSKRKATNYLSSCSFFHFCFWWKGHHVWWYFQVRIHFCHLLFNYVLKGILAASQTTSAKCVGQIEWGALAYVAVFRGRPYRVVLPKRHIENENWNSNLKFPFKFYYMYILKI